VRPAASGAALVRCRRARRSSKADREARRPSREVRQPGATGLKTGELSNLSERWPQGCQDGGRTMRPAKERKGKASRKVSGSGYGQISEGENPKGAVGMEQARQVERRGAKRACGQPTNPGRAVQPTSRSDAVRSRTTRCTDEVVGWDRQWVEANLLEHRRGKEPQEGMQQFCSSRRRRAARWSERTDGA